jgi:Replication-relaxation
MLTSQPHRASVRLLAERRVRAAGSSPRWCNVAPGRRNGHRLAEAAEHHRAGAGYHRDRAGSACSAFATNTHAARSRRARAIDRSLRPRRPGRPWRPRNPGFPGEGTFRNVQHAGRPVGRSVAEPPADLRTGAPDVSPLARHPACCRFVHRRRLLTEVARMPATTNPTARERPRPGPRSPGPSRRRSVAEQLATLAHRLTPRDRAIVRLVHEHRVFTTRQLAEVWFNSQDRAEHRLRELTDARVLLRFRPQARRGEGSAPFHYVLGPLGAAVLAAERGTEVRRLGYRADKALEVAHSQRLAHVVGVNGFFTALVASARENRPQAGPAATLTAWWSERACARRWGQLVRPDGYGRWRQGNREVDFFLEYDRGTEPLDRLAAKLAAYGELADASEIPTPVLFWLLTSGREVSVRQALAGEGRWNRVRFLVGTASPALGLSPADAAWLPLHQGWPRRRLIELAEVEA